MGTDTKAGRPRILIVEDEALIALLLETVLREAGYEIAGVASTLEAALESVAADHIDAAILDVNLRGLKVYPVAEKLARSGTPFLFATGIGLEVEGFDAHARIQKPYRVPELLAAIAAMVQRRQPPPGPTPPATGAARE